jgi:hypothetical protein
MHPGRLGILDSAAVLNTTGEGAVSAKAIQLVANREHERPMPSFATPPKLKPKPESRLSAGGAAAFDLVLPSESEDEQIETRGLQTRLDEFTFASIRNGLHFVDSQKVRNMFLRHRIAIDFANTASISPGADSAGAAFALSAISSEMNALPEADICVVGAIGPYGEAVGTYGLFAKAGEAAKAGYKLMVVPEENSLELLVLDGERLGPMILAKSLDEFEQVAIPTLVRGDGSVEWAMKGYTAAYLLYLGHQYPAARAVLETVVAGCPRHVSAQILLSRLKEAGVPTTDAPGTVMASLGPPPTQVIVPVESEPAPENGPSRNALLAGGAVLLLVVMIVFRRLLAG